VQKVPDSFGIEFVFAIEVPIEAAMGQSHDPFDRSLRKPILVKQTRSGFQDLCRVPFLCSGEYGMNFSRKSLMNVGKR
jgi:hypothetical protein